MKIHVRLLNFTKALHNFATIHLSPWSLTEFLTIVVETRAQTLPSDDQSVSLSARISVVRSTA